MANLNSPVREHPPGLIATKLRSQRQAEQGRQHQSPRFSHRWSEAALPRMETALDSNATPVAVIDVACPVLRHLRLRSLGAIDPGGCPLHGIAEDAQRWRCSFSGHYAHRTLRCASGTHCARSRGAALSPFTALRRLSPIVAPPATPQPDTHNSPHVGSLSDPSCTSTSATQPQPPTPPGYTLTMSGTLSLV
ncbi:MAG: hypothetical protein ACI8RZ_007193, partial [Myxococcota bacterium]